MKAKLGNNNIKLTVSSASDGRVYLLNDNDTYWSHPTHNTHAFTTSGTERLRISSNGYIGINNETSPSAHLHIGTLATGIGNTNVLRVDRDDGVLIYGIDL